MKALWKGVEEKVIFGNTKHGCKSILSITCTAPPVIHVAGSPSISQLLKAIKKLQGNPVL